jgi:hypothetical protein
MVVVSVIGHSEDSYNAITSHAISMNTSPACASIGRRSNGNKSAHPLIHEQSCTVSNGKWATRASWVASLYAVALATGWLLVQAGQTMAKDLACHVNWKQGHLTVTAQDIPLTNVLSKVSRQTGVEFSGIDADGCDRTDVEFSDLTLREGLERLLTGVNHAIIESKTASQRKDHLIVVIVGCKHTPATQGVRQAPGKSSLRVSQPPSLHGNTIEQVSELNAFAEQENWDALDKLASGRDPTTQTLALQLLARHDGDEAARLAVQAVRSKDQSRQLAGIQVLSGIDRPDAAVALGDALSSSDIGVRESAINALMGQTGPEAITILTQALQDPDPAIRMMALTLLAERGQDGADGLETALHNPDPAIRARASQLLDEAASQ